MLSLFDSNPLFNPSIATDVASPQTRGGQPAPRATAAPGKVGVCGGGQLCGCGAVTQCLCGCWVWVGGVWL